MAPWGMRDTLPLIVRLGSLSMSRFPQRLRVLTLTGLIFAALC